MDHKDFERKPGRLRSLIAGAAIAAASSMASTANAALDYSAEALYGGIPGVTKGVPLDLDLTCKLPIVGTNPLKVKGSVLLPPNFRKHQDYIGSDIKIFFSVEIAPDISEALNIFDVAKIVGTARAGATVMDASGATTPAELKLDLEEALVNQSGGATIVSGSGILPTNLSFDSLGPTYITLDSLSLNITTLSPEYGTGGRFRSLTGNFVETPAPLGQIPDIVCDLGHGDQNLLLLDGFTCDSDEECDLDITAPQGVDFGQTTAVNGATTKTFDITGFDASNDSMSITQALNAPADDVSAFSVEKTCSGTTCSTTVTFAPTAPGDYKANLQINSLEVLLLGSTAAASGPQPELSVDAIDFGGVMPGRTGRKVVIVTNVGTEATILGGVVTSGNGFQDLTFSEPKPRVGISASGSEIRKDEYTIEPFVSNACVTQQASDNCKATFITDPLGKDHVVNTPFGTIPSWPSGQDDCPAPTTLEPGDSCNLAIGFEPAGEGSVGGAVTVSSTGSDVSATLTGIGDSNASFDFPASLNDFAAECQFGVFAVPITFQGAVDIPSSVEPGVASPPIKIDLKATLSLEGFFELVGIKDVRGLANADLVFNFYNGSNLVSSLPIIAPVALEHAIIPFSDGAVDSSAPVDIYGFAEIPVEIAFPGQIPVIDPATGEFVPGAFNNITHISLSLNDLSMRMIMIQGGHAEKSLELQNFPVSCSETTVDGFDTIPLEKFHTVTVGDGIVIDLPADIQLDKSAISFGKLDFDAPSKTVVRIIKNTGDLALTINSITTTGDAAFSVVDNCGGSIAGGDYCTVSVSFGSDTEGSFAGELVVASSDSDEGLIAIPLTGQGPTPPVDSLKAVLEGSVDFASGLAMGVNGRLDAKVDDSLLRDAALSFTETQINTTLSGLPMVASVNLNAGNVTGDYFGGRLSVDSTIEMNLPRIYVKLFGFIKIPVGGGPNCGPSDPVVLELSGPSTGKLTGDFSLSSFSGCGWVTGMLTRSLSGSANTITVNATLQE